MYVFDEEMEFVETGAQKLYRHDQEASNSSKRCEMY
jgi:hypothetical protein